MVVQYSDLGKSARDLFGKGFNYGFYKLEVKTKTANGVEFKTNGSHNAESGKVDASLETEYSCKEHGLIFKEKWTTSNVLNTEVALKDKLAEGLKVTLVTTFAPTSGKKTGQLKTQYTPKAYNVATNLDVSLEASPVISAAAVGQYANWVAGYQGTFETSKSALKKSNFAVGYLGDDFTLHTNINDGQEFNGSYHHHVNRSLQTAVNLSWNSGSNASQFSLGGKYDVNKYTNYRIKLNNSLQLGMAFQQEVSSGVKITLSSLLEAKNLNAGGHKFGIGLDIDA